MAGIVVKAQLPEDLQLGIVNAEAGGTVAADLCAEGLRQHILSHFGLAAELLVRQLAQGTVVVAVQRQLVTPAQVVENAILGL